MASKLVMLLSFPQHGHSVSCKPEAAFSACSAFHNINKTNHPSNHPAAPHVMCGKSTLILKKMFIFKIQKSVQLMSGLFRKKILVCLNYVLNICCENQASLSNLFSKCKLLMFLRVQRTTICCICSIAEWEWGV